METFELILLLLAAVLVSTVLDQFTPRVSLPLVQIALGAIMVVAVGSPLRIQVDPELFLVLFIAPLLFDESRHANKQGLWEHKIAIVSLAVGLVLVTVLVVGFALHWLKPSIPLAAAFALGAALGPTDAAAVIALGKDISLTSRQKALLSGEALINDASGVVSFQFAIAAVVTGSFSLLEATESLLVSFFGGITVGIFLGAVALIALHVIRNSGYENATVHVVFEVFTPFIVFLLAENMSVSGILAVVAAGLFMTLIPQKPSSVSARYRIASSSVWAALIFVINGVVFVLLGMQLPSSIMPSWNSTQTSSAALIGYVLIITLLVEGIRYLWILVMEAISRDENTGAWQISLTRAQAREALVTTLAGPKGAVTLSIALTIPYYASSYDAFPHRSTLIFLASGTILCTLLLANFAVPLLARTPKKAMGNSVANSTVAAASASAAATDAGAATAGASMAATPTLVLPPQTPEVDAFSAASITVLESVIAQLHSEETEESGIATRIVISQYEERIKRLRKQNTSSARMIDLRVAALEKQCTYVQDCIDAGSISRADGQRYLRQLGSLKRMLSHGHDVHETLSEVWGRVKIAGIRTMHIISQGVRNVLYDEDREDAMRQFRMGLEQCALDYFESMTSSPDEELAEGAAVYASECRAALAALAQQEEEGEPDLKVSALNPNLLFATGVGADEIKHIHARVADIEAEALRLELEEIARMREEGLIDRACARDLREEVYLLQMVTQS